MHADHLDLRRRRCRGSRANPEEPRPQDARPCERSFAPRSKGHDGVAEAHEPFRTGSVSLGRLRLSNVDNIAESIAVAEGEAFK